MAFIYLIDHYAIPLDANAEHNFLHLFLYGGKEKLNSEYFDEPWQSSGHKWKRVPRLQKIPLQGHSALFCTNSLLQAPVGRDSRYEVSQSHAAMTYVQIPNSKSGEKLCSGNAGIPDK